MELVREENNKKIFTENNKIYYVFNMESYIGYQNREWYSSDSENWILMGVDEKCKDGGKLHTEALVDANGNYMRFIMQKGDVKRIIQLQNGRVYSDTISYHNSTYVCLDGDIYSDKQVPLNEYLSYDPKFSLNGEVFDKDVPSNSSLVEFLNVIGRIKTASKNPSRR